MYGILDQIFKVLPEEDISVNCKHYQKTHNFVKKTINYLKKTQMILRSYIQISQKKGKKKFLLGMSLFSAKI